MNIVYTNYGSTGRTEPKNLIEKLAMEEIYKQPGKGRKIKGMAPLKDKRGGKGYKGTNNNEHGIEIHYNVKIEDDIGYLGDFKFKSK